MTLEEMEKNRRKRKAVEKISSRKKTGLLRGCREVTVINKAKNDTRREKEKTREEREEAG